MSTNTTRRWSRTPALVPPQDSGVPSTAPEAPAAGWSRSRQPSLRQLARIDLVATASKSSSNRRPHTTAGSDSASLLKKPQQHWHLNAAALHSLTRSQTAKLYSLFRFYDSSSRGDSLPAIDCNRLVDILRDADILGDELSVEAVEKLFAQAVLGSLRAYLDADGRPALPFPAFCGTLMHLSVMKFPTLTPEDAMKTTFTRLDAILEPQASHIQNSTSELSLVIPSCALLRHFPSEGQLSTWQTLSSLPPDQTRLDEQVDFRAISAFPQVIADLTSDLAEQQRLDERTARAYLVPPELATQFPAGIVQLVVNKFQTFDVLNRGALPRVEMFALLSSLAKPLELADVHGALVMLLKGVPDGLDVTLMHLLETLSAIRASRRSSHVSSTAASNRRAGAVADAAPGIEENAGIDASANDEHASEVAERAAGKHKHKNHGSHSHHPHQQHPSHHASNSQHAGRHGSTTSTASRQRKNPGGNSPGKQGRKHEGTNHSRKRRPKGDMPATEDEHDRDDGAPRLPISDDTSSYTAMSSSARDGGSASDRSNDNGSAHSDAERHSGSPASVSVSLEASQLSESILEVVLLLGGDHDGAVANVLSLDLRSRRLIERRGTLLGGDRVTDPVETPVLPTQPTLTAALLVMKKCLAVRLSDGFIPHSQRQVELIDTLLTAQQLKQPHYRTPIGVLTTTKNAAPTSLPARSPIRSPTKSLTSPSTKVKPPLSPDQQQQLSNQCAQQTETSNNWVRELNEAAANASRRVHSLH